MFQICESQNKVPGKLKGRTFVLNGRQLRVGKFIAEGSYAKIYETSDERICLKYMRIESLQQLEIARRECQTLLQLRQMQNCLHLHCLYFDDEQTNVVPDEFFEVFMFVDYCPVSLTSLLQRKLNEAEVLEIFKGVANGLAEMHANGIIHRDLKVENILLLSNSIEWRSVRLCDFGSVSRQVFNATQVITDTPLRNSLQEELEANTTPQYRAPELVNLFSKFDITEKSDIFALGVVLYRIRFGNMPFPDQEQLSNYNCRWELPEQPGEVIFDLLSKTLAKDPADRLGAAQLLQLLNGQICRDEIASVPKQQAFRQIADNNKEYRAEGPSAELCNSESAVACVNRIVSAYIAERDFRVELHEFLDGNTVNELYMAVLQPISRQNGPRHEAVKLAICVFELICLQEKAKLSAFERYIAWVAQCGDGYETVFCLASLCRQLAALANIVMEQQDQSLIVEQALNSVPPLNALLTLRDPNMRNFEATIVGFACEFVLNHVNAAQGGIELYQLLYDQFQGFREFYQISLELVPVQPIIENK